MQQARDRLADAEAILGTAHPAVVVSAADYGMLYAARAAPGKPRGSRRIRQRHRGIVAAIERLLEIEAADS